MSTRHERVRAYYASCDEWSRLDSPEGRMEYRRTLGLVLERLAPGSRVLDLGGGPGRYAADLAQQGHRVVLADLSPALLEAARERLTRADVRALVESIDEANAVDLGLYQGESFDAVLALGPFYHLLAQGERERAGREIARVLRSGGLAFVAFIPRISGITGLIQRAAEHPEQVPVDVLRATADTGAFRSASDAGFQEGYYPWPGELERLFGAPSFELLEAVSLRSIAYGLSEELAKLDGLRRAEVERLVEELSRRPEVLATCGHALLIARRVGGTRGA